MSLNPVESVKNRCRWYAIFISRCKALYQDEIEHDCCLISVGFKVQKNSCILQFFRDGALYYGWFPSVIKMFMHKMCHDIVIGKIPEQTSTHNWAACVDFQFVWICACTYVVGYRQNADFTTILINRYLILILLVYLVLFWFLGLFAFVVKEDCFHSSISLIIYYGWLLLSVMSKHPDIINAHNNVE